MGVILEIWSEIWGQPPLKFGGPKTPNFSQFSTLLVHCSGTDQDITNIKTDFFTRDIHLPDSERMAYFGTPWITTKWLICTHYNPNTNNHCISIHERAPQWAEVFQLSVELIFSYYYYYEYTVFNALMSVGWNDKIAFSTIRVLEGNW